MSPDPVWTRRVLLTLTVWLLVASGVGLLGLYEGAPAPVIGATNAVLVALTLIAVVRIRGLRTWAEAVSLRPLVLYHLVRFVGIAFLVLYARGVIPGAFALVAGWGDIAVAVLAIPAALLCVPVSTRARWWGLLAWNAFGLADILLVLGNGMRLGLADIAEMAWITVFPWTLLPTFIVPLVITTHVWIFVRLWRL
ncbi:MAG: hypothetical protein AAFQ43_07380, partial [Bacteroidota bacterium]